LHLTFIRSPAVLALMLFTFPSRICAVGSSEARKIWDSYIKLFAPREVPRQLKCHLALPSLLSITELIGVVAALSCSGCTYCAVLLMQARPRRQRPCFKHCSCRAPYALKASVSKKQSEDRGAQFYNN